jgi:hypothetical protein
VPGDAVAAPCPTKLKSLGASSARLWLGRLVLAERQQAAILPTLAAAILLLAANGQSLYWQAAGGVLCLLAGIAYAWVLLIEILR